MTKMSKTDLESIAKAVREQYRAELDAMAKTKDRPHGLTKKTIEDLVAGHSDGLRNMVTALRSRGVIVVEE